MKYLRCAIVIALLPLVAFSWWRIIPLDEAVKDSDMIIVGTLRHVSEETRDEFDYGAGELTVDEVLSGSLEEGQKLSLAWKNESGVICPRIVHQNDQNKQLIWLLKMKPDGKVAADNPGRYIAVENKETVIRLLSGIRKSKKAR